MATAGSIVIDLLMKTGAFETDIARAEAIAKKRAQAIEQAFSGMGTRIAGAAVAAGGALAAMIWSTAETAKEISNLATLSGAGATEFQRFAAAAKSVGVQQDQLGDMFKDFREKIGEFVSTGGGEMKDFFEQVAPKVGITADAFRNLSGPQALQLFYDSLEKAGLSTEQMSFYLESAANDTTKLIPLLRDGGKELKTLGDEAERTGRVMNDDAIKAAAELSKNMDELGGNLTGIKNQIASEFIPTLNYFSGKFLTIAKDVGLAQAALITFGEVVAMSLGIDELSKLSKEAKVAQLNVQSLGRQLETAKGLPSWFGGDEQTLAKIQGKLDAETKRVAQINSQIQALKDVGKPKVAPPLGSPDAMTRGLIPSGGSGSGGGSGGSRGGSGGGSKPSTEKVTEAQRLLESMQRQLQTALKLTELEKLQADIQSKKIEGLTPAIQAQLIGLAKQIDLSKELEEFDRATADYLKEREAFEKSIVSLRKELMTDEERNADALKTQLELIGQIKDASERGDLTRRAIGKATAEAPEFGGLAPEVAGPFGELAKIDEAEEKLNEWYEKQLEMLARFREERADLTAEFDEEELQLKQQHQAKLMQIESARSIAQLSAAENLFGNLADLTKNFAGEQSGIYKTMFALQKAAAIAQSIIAIQQGIAMAAANPWPINLAAMASVAAATAGLISNISGVTLNARATGGPVSQSQPYLVGERGPELFVPNTNGAIVPNNKLGGGNVTVNLIEDKSRAGKTEERTNNGARELDVFVADIMGDGPRGKAIQRAFGLQRRGY